MSKETNVADLIQMFQKFNFKSKVQNRYLNQLISAAQDLEKRVESLKLTLQFIQGTEIELVVIGIDKLGSRIKSELNFLTKNLHFTPQQLNSTNLSFLSCVYITLVSAIALDIQLHSSEITGVTTKKVCVETAVLTVISKRGIDVISSKGSKWWKVIWENPFSSNTKMVTAKHTQKNVQESDGESSDSEEWDDKRNALYQLAQSSARNIQITYIVPHATEYSQTSSKYGLLQRGYPLKHIQENTKDRTAWDDIATLVKALEPPIVEPKGKSALNLDPTTLITLSSDLVHSLTNCLEYAKLSTTNPDFASIKFIPAPIVHQMQTEFETPFFPRFHTAIQSHFATADNATPFKFDRNCFVLSFETWKKCGEILKLCGGRGERRRMRGFLPRVSVDNVVEKLNVSIESFEQLHMLQEQDFNATLVAHWTLLEDVTLENYVDEPPSFLREYFPLQMIERLNIPPCRPMISKLPKLSPHFLEAAWTRSIPTFTTNTTLSRISTQDQVVGVKIVFVEGCKTFVGKRNETNYDYKE